MRCTNQRLQSTARQQIVPDDHGPKRGTQHIWLSGSLAIYKAPKELSSSLLHAAFPRSRARARSNIRLALPILIGKLKLQTTRNYQQDQRLEATQTAKRRALAISTV